MVDISIKCYHLKNSRDCTIVYNGQVGWWGIVWSCVTPHWSTWNLTGVSVLVRWWSGAWQTWDNSVTPPNADEMLTSSVRPPNLKFKFLNCKSNNDNNNNNSTPQRYEFIRKHSGNKLKSHCMLLNSTSLRTGLCAVVLDTKSYREYYYIRNYIVLPKM